MSEDNGAQKGAQGRQRHPGILGKKADHIAVDDPVSTRVDTGLEETVRVSRRVGACEVCGLVGGQVVCSYDPRVFEGWACPECILAGKASKAFPPTHKAMRPMVFVARALRGDQPFRDLLKAADLQRDNPEATAALKGKMSKLIPLKAAGNRKQRRAGLKRAKVAVRKAKATAKKGDR